MYRVNSVTNFQIPIVILLWLKHLKNPWIFPTKYANGGWYPCMKRKHAFMITAHYTIYYIYGHIYVYIYIYTFQHVQLPISCFPTPGNLFPITQVGWSLLLQSHKPSLPQRSVVTKAMMGHRCQHPIIQPPNREALIKQHTSGWKH